LPNLFGLYGTNGVLRIRFFVLSIHRTHVFLADAWMLNGTPLFMNTTFGARQDMLKSIFALHTPCPEFETRAIRLRDDITDIRGYEYYNNMEGEERCVCRM